MIKIYSEYSIFKKSDYGRHAALIPCTIYLLSPNTITPTFLELSEAVVEVFFHEVPAECDQNEGECCATNIMENKVRSSGKTVS